LPSGEGAGNLAPQTSPAFTGELNNKSMSEPNRKKFIFFIYGIYYISKHLSSGGCEKTEGFIASQLEVNLRLEWEIASRKLSEEKHSQ